jgi:serine/threonine protein phosphatase PrpC
MTVLRAGLATDIGRARHTNEDRAAASDTLFAVADGMGGARGGEVAARLAIETLQTVYARNPTIAGLREAFVAANAAIWEQSLRVDELRGMGTTMTAAGLTVGADGRDVIGLANVGDSRAYLMSGGVVRQITADHSLAEERVRHGEMTEAEAEVHPHRHILTRALGVAPEVDVDLWELHVHTGDRLLLCSDGLTNEVGIDQISQVLQSVRDPRKAARALVDRANAHGGSDNVTVVVVDVLVGEEGPATPFEVARVAVGEDGTARLSPVPPPAGNGQPAPPGPVMPTSAQDLGVTSVTETVVGLGAEANPAGAVAVVMAAPSAPVLPAQPGRRELALRPREPRRERLHRLGVPRRVTLRVVLFFLVLLAVPAGAVAVVRWYAMDNWYVAIDRGDLAVYQGRPGGFLGFEPRLVELSTVTTAEVLPFRLADLRRTVSEPTLVAAKRYIANLHQEFLTQQAATRSAGL